MPVSSSLTCSSLPHMSPTSKRLREINEKTNLKKLHFHFNEVEIEHEVIKEFLLSMQWILRVHSGN